MLFFRRQFYLLQKKTHWLLSIKYVSEYEQTNLFTDFISVFFSIIHVNASITLRLIIVAVEVHWKEVVCITCKSVLTKFI